MGKNREQWLMECAKMLEEDFQAIGYECHSDSYRISCGFSSRGALSKKSKRIGECWSTAVSSNGLGEIFISPLLDNPIDVLGVVTHEMIHHIVGCECGHKGPFKRCAKAIGLEGKMTATTIGEKLSRRLNAIWEKVGNYPHYHIDPKAKPKKDGTRMIKFECMNCGWVGRTTQKWIDVGLPQCHCGGKFNTV